MGHEEDRTKSLDTEIAKIQKSTRSSIAAMVPLHDILRQKYSWYYLWHLNPIASKVHIALLVLYTIFIIGLGTQVFVGPSKEAKAASCTSAGGGIEYGWSDPGSWAGCGEGVPGSGDSVTILGGDTMYLDIAGVTVASLTIDDGGELNLLANPITVTGNLTNNCALNANSSTVSVGGSFSSSAPSCSGATVMTTDFSGSTIIMNSTTTGKTFKSNVSGSYGILNIVTFNGVGGGWTLNGSIDVNGNLNITNGTLAASTYNINAAGSLAIGNGATFTKGSGTLTLDGAAQNISDANATPNDLGAVATGGSGTKTMTDDLTVTSLNIADSTTFNLGTTSYTLTMTGTGTPLNTNTSGTFNKGTGSTTVYTGTTTATNITTVVYNNLTLTPSGATTYNLTGNLTGGSALTGNLTINSNATLDVRPASTDYSITAVDFTISGTLDATSSSATFTASGNWDHSSGTFTSGTSTVELAGTGTLNIQPGWQYRFYNLSVAAIGATTTLLSHIEVMHLTTGTGELTDSTNNYEVTLSGTDNVLIDSGAVLTFFNLTYRPGDGGNQNILAKDYTGINNLRCYGYAPSTDNTCKLQGNITANAIMVGSNTAKGTILDTSPDGGSTSYNITAASLTLGDSTYYGGLLANNSAININGNVTFTNSTSYITAGGSSWTVSGNWTNSGIFTAGSSTVTLNATGAGKTIKTNNSSFSTLAINGVGGGWTLDTNSLAATTLNITAGTLNTGALGLNVSGTTTLNGGNLTGAAGNMLFGSGSPYGGGLNITGASSTFTASATVSILNSYAHSAGTADWTTNSSALTWTADAGKTLPADTYYALSLFDTTFTLASGTTTVNNDLTITSDLGACTLAVGGETLTVAGNLAIGGSSSLTATSGTINVGGNWSNAGTFTAGAGSTVDFTKTSGIQTLDPGAPFVFAILKHSGGGTLKLSGNPLSVGDFIQTAGTFDANGQNQNFFGDFSLSAGTTYTKGGTLTFRGGVAKTFEDLTVSKQNLGTVAITKTNPTPSNNKITLKTSAGNGMKVDTLTISANNTLELASGGYTLEIANAGATADVLTCTGTLTSGTSTVKYSATNSGGNVNIAVCPYNALQLSGAETYDLAGNLTVGNAITGELTVDNGATLNMSSKDITTNGMANIAGTFTGTAIGTATFGVEGGGGLSIEATGDFTAPSSTTVSSCQSFHNLGTADFTSTESFMTFDAYNYPDPANPGGPSGPGTCDLQAGTYYNAQVLNGTFNLPVPDTDPATDDFFVVNNEFYVRADITPSTLNISDKTLTVRSLFSIYDADDVVNGGTGTINIGGNWTNNGTFNKETGLVNFNGSADQTVITNNQAFHNLTLNNTGDADNDDIIISGNLDIDGALTITDGDLYLSTNNPNINTAGSVSIASGGLVTKGTGTWTFDGTTTYTDSNVTKQNIGAVLINGTSVDLASDMITDALTVTAGTVRTYDKSLTTNGLTTLNGGNLTGGSGVFQLAGLAVDNASSTFTAPSLTYITAGTYTRTAGTVNWTANTSTLATGQGQTLPVDTYHKLTVRYFGVSGDFTLGTGTTTVNSNLELTGTIPNYPSLAVGDQTLSVSGNITIGSGTTLSAIGTINVGGDWSNSGTFNGGTGTVNFTDTDDALLTGDTTFNNLDMDISDEAGGKTITFTADSTQTIGEGGIWTLNGATEKVLTLRSSTPGTAWKFVIPADMNSGNYITVSDSQNNTNDFRIMPGSNVTDSGNNFPGWLFTPATPTIGSGEAISATAIKWQFTDNASNETGFEVHDSGEAVVAACEGADLTFCTETGLDINTQYSDRHVHAKNGPVLSEPSGTATAIYTLANTPAAPTVNATSTTSLTIIIDVNSNPPVTQFAIYNNTLAKYVQADGSSGDDAVWQNYATWGGASGIANTGLTAATAYDYKVKSQNGDGTETALSPSTSQTTLSGGSRTPTPTPSPTATPISSPTATPTGEVTPSPTVTSPATKDTGAPTAPTNLRATKLGAITLTIDWDASTDDTGVSGYQIYNLDTKIMVGTTSDTTFGFVGLTPNTTYKFYVSAFDAIPNYSTNSGVLTITTLESRTAEEQQIEQQGGLAAFLVMVGLPEEAAAGQPFPGNIKITAADVGGGIVKGYAKAIFFTSTDTLAKLAYGENHPYTFTTADQGIHEFAPRDFVLNTPGRQQLTVSDYSLQSTDDINVTSPAASIFQRSAIYVQGFLSNPAYVSRMNIAVAVLIAMVIILPTLVVFLSNLNSLIPQFIYGFNSLARLLGWRRRRKDWGVVFNSQTGQPIPFAVVKLLDKNKQLQETSITDNQGRYGFALKRGAYHLSVSRADYIYPSESKDSSFYERVYAGAEIKIADAKQSITFNIPLDPHARSTFGLNIWVWLVNFNRFLQKLRLPLLILGAILAIIMIILSFHLVYVVFLAFCILVGILDFLRLRDKVSATGIVSDVFSRVISGAIVRIYHKESNRLIDIDISARGGRFEFLVEPGIYYLVATKPKYIDFKSHLMYLQKEKQKKAITSINIKLKKIA